MKITILNTSEKHPINQWLKLWMRKHQNEHQIELLRSKTELKGGDLLFLISCSELISEQDRKKYKKTLVIHASDLPKGRGWSPHVWEIINNKENLTITLLEAEDKVDSGAVWKKIFLKVPKVALFNEINQIVFDGELELMDYAVEYFDRVIPQKQAEIDATYWPKRVPSDSEININKSINEQFNLLRVCDSERFPAFFYKDGRKFIIKIEAVDE
jgi:methionyl-tRNA formyltransferase